MKLVPRIISYEMFLQQELPGPQEQVLHQPAASSYLVVDLFAGCGGMSLGFEAMGFKTIGYEMLEDACSTYTHNLRGSCQRVKLERNPEISPSAAVIIGGPPCQPFSVGGYQHGLKDSRDGFPIFLDAVAEHRPQIGVFENVRGMLYRNKAYFEEIVQSLSDLGYRVEWQLLNAIDYGVPQRRERLFCVAHRSKWRWPAKTYSHRPYTSGEALGDLVLQMPESARFLTESMDAYVKRYEIASQCQRPRDLHLDNPSRTVTCRNLSGATGDMLRIKLPDGRRRRLTVREGARLQSFPDWFEIMGREQSQFDQIGNAVPPLLAKALARSVLACLEDEIDEDARAPIQLQLLAATS